MKLRTLAATGLFLAAATAPADTVVYDLDPKNAVEIRNALQAVLGAQCQQGGGNPNACHVELLPTGQLLVAAPEAAQPQIAAVLKAVASRNAAPTPRVALQYWVISGAPGKPDAADPALKPLNAVLQQLEKLHGELGFKVEDTVMLTTQSGSNASNSGGSFEVRESVRAAGDSVNADVRLKFTRMAMPAPLPQGSPVAVSVPFQSELNVLTAIRRGEYVVLGESKFGMADQPGTLFYVVHWPEGQ